MTYRHEEPLDIAEVAARVQAEIDRQKLTFATVSTVAAALQRFDGKPITKRLATAVEAALPGMTVYYDLTAGMAYLNIWQGKPESVLGYNNRIHVMLGYMQSGMSPNGGIYSHDKFVRPPAPDSGRYADGGYCGHAWTYLRYGQDVARVESMLAALPETVPAYNAALAAFNVSLSAFAAASWAVFPDSRR